MNYTDEQRRAIETVGLHLCVDAGAGSGKTRVLVDRIVQLLRTNAADLDEIVAITFTEKAAAEMKERLRRACRAMAPPEASSQTMTYWREIERKVDDARVMTIHAFCAGLLREHALAAGIDPEFRLLEEAESELLRTETARDALESLLAAGNSAALRVATEFGLRQTVELLAGLLRQSVTMSRIRAEHPCTDAPALAVHWNALAEAERHRRLLAFARSGRATLVRSRLEELGGNCTKPTDARELGRIEFTRLLDSIAATDDPNLIAACLDEVAAFKFAGTRKENWQDHHRLNQLIHLQKKIVEIAKTFIEPETNEQDTLAAAHLAVAIITVYSHVDRLYTEEKSRRRCMDFEDLIARAQALLETNDAVRAECARGIKHLLIDEFQDTDRGQLQIARLLRRDDGRPGAELFIVGDAKQSIYNFRGAEIQVFSEASREAQDVIPLHTNFRALPDALRFINDFFAQNLALETEHVQFKPLEPHRDPVNEPRIEFLVPATDEKADADTKRRAEAELIAGRIAALCGGTHAAQIVDPASGELRPARYGDAAILFRASTNLHIYEEQLRRYGVPYQVITGGGFYERQEVLDISNLLKVLHDRTNAMALLGFLRSPIVALTDSSIFALAQTAPLAQAFWSNATLENPDQNGRLSRARALIRELDAHLDRPLPELLRAVLRLTNYESILLAGPHGVQRAGNLRKMLDLASQFRTLGAPSLPDFIQYLDEAGAHRFSEGDAPLFMGDAGAVTLLTIHKAKGLEFPIVAVADLGQGRRAPDSTHHVRVHKRLGLAASFVGPDGERRPPPIYDAIKRAQSAEDESENARILYVAMTRARDWLLLGCAAGNDSSWSAALDAAYGIASQPHGAVIARDGWSGTVHSEVPPPNSEFSRQRHEKATDVDSTIPITLLLPITPNTIRKSISVSALLDRMRPTTPHAWSRSTHAIDPRIRGDIIHRYFQQWNFPNDSPPEIARFLRETLPDRNAHSALEHDLVAIADRFMRSSLFANFASAGPIQKEIPFLFRLDNRVVSGTIDLLIRESIAIDYKTGQPNEELSGRYEDQLRIYAAALRAISGQTSIAGQTSLAATLYYVDTGEARSVDTSPDAIADTLARARNALHSPDQT